MKFSFLFLAAFLLLSSCSDIVFDSKEELITYINDKENGFIQEQEVNDVKAVLLLRPTDLMVSQEISFQQDSIFGNIDSLRNKYQDYLYFNLSLSKNSEEVLNSLTGNRNEFGAMVTTLAFGMNEKIEIVTESRDTLEMTDYVYPRMYGMSNSTSMLLVFPKENIIQDNDSFRVVLKDIGIGTGEISFKYPVEILKKDLIIDFKI